MSVIDDMVRAYAIYQAVQQPLSGRLMDDYRKAQEEAWGALNARDTEVSAKALELSDGELAVATRAWDGDWIQDDESFELAFNECLTAVAQHRREAGR